MAEFEQEETLEPGPSAADALVLRRERLRQLTQGSLRRAAARGVFINSGFSIGLQGLSVIRGLVVARFLSPRDYGVWAIIVIGYSALAVLKQVGIADKYIQQDDPDEEGAFQRAFTLEAMVTGGFWLLLMAVTPLIALAYREPRIIAPGLVALLAMPGGILETPIWVYTRRMDFKRQRILGAVDPLAGMIVTIAVAAAGGGYWCFVAGNVAGTWLGAAVILRHAPYPIRLRYDRAVARQYIGFSRPIFFANLSRVFLLQGTTLVARSAIGVAGIGAMSLGNTIRNYTEFADGIVSQTMYPAVCAVKDRVDLLYESFVKSNRVALMWGAPFGLGAVLFAPDFVHYVIGDRWHNAVFLFQAIGLTSAIGHIAFNWDDYIRARGDTRPMMRYGWIGLAGWTAAPIPLMLTHGLHGYAYGLGVVTLVNLSVRTYYMTRLFSGFSMLPHGLRAITPAVAALGLVVALRGLEPTTRTPALVLAEVATFGIAVVVFTSLIERTLVKEAFGYLRARAQPS